MTAPPRSAIATDPHDDVDTDGDDGREHVLLVEAGQQLYAMNVRGVREVLRRRAITRVPATPRTMLGLVNVRGMVVTVLDLLACDVTACVPDIAESAATKLAGTVTAPRDGRVPNAPAVTVPRAETGGSIVLLEHGNRVAGVAVDRVRDVRTLDDTVDDSVDDALSTVDGARRGDGVARIARAGGEVVIVLDVAAFIARHLISSGET